MTPSNTPDLLHPKYRADIDGLRAVAVLSVVGFHAFPSWVKGGFIGVDIFFVISGFLISTIIIGSLERKSFSFLEFYGRRIKRIFPALLVVLIASLAFGWFALLSDEYKQLGKHVAGGAGFVSNFLLWKENGYFDNASETKPLLHLWSLGIEEQYYIIWPLLLWFALRERLNLLYITLIVAAISFALNVDKVGKDLAAAFYSPQTRFWELMAGSILAHMTLHGRRLFPASRQRLDGWLDGKASTAAPEQSGRTLRNLQSVLGAALIAAGVMVITNTSRFPGWWAVLPVLGAALIIAAGPRAWLNRVVLSNPVLVWFGLISFPLYLWHWPLLSFARILTSAIPSVEVRIGAVLLGIALAWLTYRFIERPIRFGSKTATKVWVLVLMMTAVGALGYYINFQDGLGGRVNVTAGAINERAHRHGGFYNGAQNCADRYTPLTANTWCAKKDGDPVVAVIGDSHAGQLFLGIRDASDAELNKAIFMGAGSCYPTEGWDSREGCGKQLQLTFDIVESMKTVKYVIVQGYYGWSNQVVNAEGANLVLNGYRKTIDHFRAMGKKVVFAIDNPALGFDPDACLAQNRPIMKLFENAKSEKVACPNEYTENLLDQSKYRAYIDELAASYPDVLFYDPRKRLCGNGACKIIDHGLLLYSDANHLSQYGSSYLAEDLFAQMRSKWK